MGSPPARGLIVMSSSVGLIHTGFCLIQLGFRLYQIFLFSLPPLDGEIVSEILCHCFQWVWLILHGFRLSYFFQFTFPARERILILCIVFSSTHHFLCSHSYLGFYGPDSHKVRLIQLSFRLS